MEWLFLLLAGVCEIGLAIGMKHCDGFKITPALLLVIISTIMNITFFGLAIKSIPLGIAYVVWCGVGIAGVFLYGALVLKEETSLINLIFVGLIIVGVIGLRLIKSH